MNIDLNLNERRQWARSLYTQNRKTIRETAHEVAVDEATVRAWILEGEWDLVRRSLLISKQAQIDRLYELVEQLNAKITTEEGLTPKDADLMVKYTAAIKNLDTENSVYAIVEAAELFITWLYTRNTPLAQTFTRQFQLFIKERKAA